MDDENARLHECSSTTRTIHHYGREDGEFFLRVLHISVKIYDEKIGEVKNR